jgi:hypothetical protein
MDTFFLLCAVIGGTIMLLQFALTVFGLGGHHSQGDFSGGDIGHAGTGHGMSADLSGSHGQYSGVDSAAGHDASLGDSHSGSHDPAAHDQATHDQQQHDTVWFFRIITFQTLVAAVAFFGIAGRAAREADVPPITALLIAAGVGFAAMNAVYYLVRSLNKFNADGTLQISRAVGLQGTVYLPIPGAHAGAGKIHMTLQNRMVELQATTLQDRLPSGAKVKVISVVGPDTVQVERLIEAEIASHV